MLVLSSYSSRSLARARARGHSSATFILGLDKIGYDTFIVALSSPLRCKICVAQIGRSFGNIVLLLVQIITVIFVIKDAGYCLERAIPVIRK